VCLPLEARDETMESLMGWNQWGFPMESPQWSHQVHSINTDSLISDAPSKSVNHCLSILRKIFNFIPGNGARNVSIRSHSWIVIGAEPNAHHFMS
jgi:hypothetical protein